LALSITYFNLDIGEKMKNNNIKLSFIAMAALFAAGCAATEYTDPSAATKTGTSASGTYNAIDLTTSGFALPTVTIGAADATCQGIIAASGGAQTLNDSSFTLGSGVLGLGPVSTGDTEVCGNATFARIPNPKVAGASDFKLTISGTYTIPETASAARASYIYFTRAFQGDLDGDGLTDTLAYTFLLTNLNAAGARVGVTRTLVFTKTTSADFLGVGGGALASNVNSVSSNTNAVAALTTAGDHTFTITQSAGSNGVATITVTIDGAAVTITAENPAADIGTTEQVGFRYKGSAATLYGLLTNSAIPANGLVVGMGARVSAGTPALYPRIKNLKVTVN
jgi:hypothetical protein